MQKYSRLIMVSLVASFVLSLCMAYLVLHPSITNGFPGLLLMFLQFFVVPFYGFSSGRSKEHSFRQGLLYFGIALLVAIAVALITVLPAFVTREKARKLRCEQDNERTRIRYETYGYPDRGDGLPFVYTPTPCN